MFGVLNQINKADKSKIKLKSIDKDNDFFRCLYDGKQIIEQDEGQNPREIYLLINKEDKEGWYDGEIFYGVDHDDRYCEIGGIDCKSLKKAKQEAIDQLAEALDAK